MPAEKPQEANAPTEDGPWPHGLDTFRDPTIVEKGFYRWGINVISRGGMPRTRPGFSVIPVTTDGVTPLIGSPRGITIFEDVDGNFNLTIAIGSGIYFTQYPFTGPFTQITSLSFSGIDTPVVFVRCMVSVTEAADGTLTDIDPYPVLMIQDGLSPAGYWVSGQNARHLDPSKNGPSETPSGLWSAWSGNRYWVADGPRLRASNLLNPLKFTEENLLEEGGFMMFASDIVGMTNTFDFSSLLVFTDTTTSAVATSTIDRTQWATTLGFQKVIFSGIGSAGGKSMATQWGMVWWYTHDGLISLNEGLKTYGSSKVTYFDREMAWSRQNISRDFEDNICMGSFENLLFVSVPSGDKYNSHTWVMDEAPLDSQTYWGYFGLTAWPSIWEGVRPVEWVTAHIMGQKRCFCLSQDYGFGNPDVGPLQNNVWEMVTPARMDKSIDSGGNILVKPISCSLETKLLGYDGNYKFFRFAEIYLDNAEGEVDLKVSYAGRRGGYKQVLTKHIVSSDFIMINNPLANQTPIPVDSFVFDPTRPQQRVVRTISEAKTYDAPKSGDDIYQGIQTSGNIPFPRQKDYAFSILIEWTGRMSISSVRVYFDPDEQETEGVTEVIESANQMVDMAGLNYRQFDPAIGFLYGDPTTILTPYSIDLLSQDFQSHPITGNYPIWKDPVLSSMS